MYWTRFPVGTTDKVPVVFSQLLPSADTIAYAALQNTVHLLFSVHFILAIYIAIEQDCFIFFNHALFCNVI